MKVVIIHHPKPYHLDDFLAVSLLLYKYSSDDVTRITVSQFSLEDVEKLASQYDLVIAVDIGKILYISPNIKIYDHHHDIDIPSSLVLVLKHEFPELWRKITNIPKLRNLINFIDFRDRFGLPKALQKFSISDNVGIIRFYDILLSQEPSREVGEAFINLVNSYYSVSEKVSVYNISGIKVAVTEEDPKKLPTSVIFDVIDAELLLQPNVRNLNHTSVIKNSLSPKYNSLNLANLKSRYNVVFLHPNGFLAVIDKPVSRLKHEIDKIVNLIT